MKIFYYYLLLLCQCFVAACNSVEREGTVFPQEETVTQELLLLHGVTNPVRIEIDYPFLMIQNWKRTDSLFHVYDLNNFEFKSAFGIEGQGPDDFTVPDLCSTQFPGFLISDITSVYYIEVNDRGEVESKTKKEVRFIEGTMNAAFINDSLFVMHAEYLGPELYLLSLQDELPRKKKQVRSPKIMDPSLDPDLSFINANESRIALSYYWKKQIDFLDTDLNLIKSVKFDYPYPRTISGNLREIRSNYLPGYFGKKYFYALFRGVSNEEYFANPSAYNDFLEVFDLDGNPIIRYRLDGKGMSRFVVDENTFTLYGIINDGVTEDYLGMYRLTGLE